MKNELGWEAIKAKSEEIGLPTAFRTDLDIDRDILLEETDIPTGPIGECFGWAVRDTGTDIFIAEWLGDINTRRWYETVIKARPNKHWFWFNGEELVEISADEMMPLIEATYSSHHTTK